jgi:hypothetical protein
MEKKNPEKNWKGKEKENRAIRNKHNNTMITFGDDTERLNLLRVGDVRAAAELDGVILEPLLVVRHLQAVCQVRTD